MSYRAEYRRVIRFVVLVAIAVAVISPVPARSSPLTPWAGVEHRARGFVELRDSIGAIHRLEVEVHKLVLDRDSPPPVLLVRMETCHRGECGGVRTFKRELQDADFSMSPEAGSATLRTLFAGKPLSVTWSRTWSRQPANSGLWSDISYAAIVVGPGGDASVSIRVLGSECKAGEGDVMTTLEMRPNGYREQYGELSPRTPRDLGIRGQPTCLDRTPRGQPPQSEATRIIRGVYDAPGSALGVHGIAGLGRIGGVTIETNPGEKFLSLQIRDEVGESVYAVVGIDTTGDRVLDDWHGVCTATRRPIRLLEGNLVVVEIHAGPCLYPRFRPAAATWGSFEITLSDLP